MIDFRLIIVFVGQAKLQFSANLVALLESNFVLAIALRTQLPLSPL